ncbi:hypothetical protein JCM1841_005128 [Sporobolomyces salmonicolor]
MPSSPSSWVPNHHTSPPLAYPYSPTPSASISRLPQTQHGSYRGPRPPPGAGHAPPDSTYAQLSQQPFSQDEEPELARVRHESLALERERLDKLAAEEERLWRQTLAESTALAEQERRRSESLAQQRAFEEEAAVREALMHSRASEQAEAVRTAREERRRVLEEEKEVQRVLAESRLDVKGKGKARDRGEERDRSLERREREALDLAMRLSLQESERQGRAETSVEAFERWSRREPTSAVVETVNKNTSPPHASSSNHPLFDRPATPSSSTASPPTSSIPLHHGLVAQNTDSRTLIVDPDDNPPAYEYAAFAPEHDEPGDVIVGPGRPLPASSPLVASTSHPIRALSSRISPPPLPLPVPSAPSSPLSRPWTAPPSSSPLLFHGLYHHPPPDAAPSSVGPHSLLADPASCDYPLQADPTSYNSDQRSSPEPGSFSRYSTVYSTTVAAGSFEEPPSVIGTPSVRSQTSLSGLAEEENGHEKEVEYDEDPFDDRFAAEFAYDGEDDEIAFAPTNEDNTAEEAAREPRDLSATTRLSHPAPQAVPAEQPVDASLAAPRRPSLIIDDLRTQHMDDEQTPHSATTAVPTSPTSLPSGNASSPSTAHPSTARPTSSSGPASPSGVSPSPHPTPSSSPSPNPSPSLDSVFRSIPSFGGVIQDVNSTAFADQYVLDGVRWGFVDVERSSMHPPLEHEGDFPRGAQLSTMKNEEGKQQYISFAVEAKSWQALLVYLMWHGNSRLEASPHDLQADKSGRGLQGTIHVEFFRSFLAQSPRVRCRLDLLPFARTRPMSPTTSSRDSSSTTSTPSFDADCPNIQIQLAQQPFLPIPLAGLATILSKAHTCSRQQARRQHRTSSAMSTQRGTLAEAVDLLKRLNGEPIMQDAGQVEEAEIGLLDKLKSRLRRTKKPRVIKGGAEGTSETYGALPEGAMLITPFALEP